MRLTQEQALEFEPLTLAAAKKACAGYPEFLDDAIQAAWVGVLEAPEYDPAKATQSIDAYVRWHAAAGIKHARGRGLGNKRYARFKAQLEGEKNTHASSDRLYSQFAEEETLPIEPAWQPDWDRLLDGGKARETLARLAPQHRAALTLRYLDDLPVRKVAQHLGRSVHATESLLVRARHAFRRTYSDGEWRNNAIYEVGQTTGANPRTGQGVRRCSLTSGSPTASTSRPS
jgi:RNA polymerase sigma factor (sigma-70 family)